MIDELCRDPEIVALAKSLSGVTAENEEVIARVAWHTVTEPGDGAAGALIAGVGAAQAWRIAFDDDGADAHRALNDARKRWRPRLRADAVRDALRAARDVRASLCVPGDECWPVALDDLGDHAPTLLWVRGDAAALAETPRIAIVGARAASAYGDHVAAEIAGDLAAGGFVVVSGGAYGIDGAAHRAALGAGGRTIAFLAGGVDRAYPAGHAHLFREISQDGCVLSEVPCGSAPTKWRFLARNRLIAALGEGTVVVEAGWRSGSLNTAGHAASLGRALGAVPGPVTSPASAGCHRLMREYDAQCVTSAADVREMLGYLDDSQGAVNDTLTAEQVRLLDAGSTRKGCSVGELAQRSGLAPDRVESILGILALDGHVHRDSEGLWRNAAQRAHTSR